MRVEPAPRVYRNEDRRQRSGERRSFSNERRSQPRGEQRAQHAPHVWFQPAFGAHILGQIAPATASPANIARAYQQPESRTPLRPGMVQSA